MDHIRLPAQDAECGEGCSSEDSKTLGIILEAVDTIARGKKRLVPQEVDRDLSIEAAANQVHVLLPRSDRDLKGFPNLLQVESIAVDGAIARYHHSNIVTRSVDGPGERAGHIGQTAHLGKRRRFGGDEKDFEWLFGHGVTPLARIGASPHLVPGTAVPHLSFRVACVNLFGRSFGRSTQGSCYLVF